MDSVQGSKCVPPNGSRLMPFVYSLPGRAYEALYVGLTLGLEERIIKAPAVRRLDLQPGQTVLDWGCGTGLLLPHIAAQLGTGFIVCVDASPSLIRLAARRQKSVGGPKTCFALCDGSAGLCLGTSVDVAIASYSLGIMNGSRQEMALREIRRVLNSGGKLLIIDMYMPETENRWLSRYHRTHAFFARGIFGQDFSGSLLKAARSMFQEISFQVYPSLLAYAWIGRRE